MNVSEAVISNNPKNKGQNNEHGEKNQVRDPFGGQVIGCSQGPSGEPGAAPMIV